MNSKDVTILIMDLQQEVTDKVNKALDFIVSEFNPNVKEMSNSDVDHIYIMHNRMAAYQILSHLSTAIKKQADVAKKNLDDQLDKMDIDHTSVPGMTKNIYSNDLFSFDKKQNVDGTTTLVVDLVTQLARAGVEKSIVDEAVRKASKVRKGNVYYQIGTK